MFKQLRRIQARIFLGRESDKIAGSHDPANFGRLVISAGNHNHESFFGRCFFSTSTRSIKSSFSGNARPRQSGTNRKDLV